MFGWLGDAAAADVDAAVGRQHHVDHADLAQFSQHATRFIAQAGGLHHLMERLPKHVGQEADKDVGQHPVFALMPHGTNSQVGFVNSKCGFSVPIIIPPKVTLLSS